LAANPFLFLSRVQVFEVRMQRIRPHRAVPGRAAAAKRCPFAERNILFRPNGRPALSARWTACGNVPPRKFFHSGLKNRHTAFVRK
jgi:hypothetical protein